MTFALLMTSLCGIIGPSNASAHHPDREHQRIWPRIDVIPPLGYHLPMEYRRRFNRPTKVGGWIAYHIEPTSQEAMAWHDATHQRAYSDHRGRLEKHFFYPKPWEGLQLGPREESSQSDREKAEARAATRELREALQADDRVLSTDALLPNASSLIEELRSGPSVVEAAPTVIEGSEPAITGPQNGAATESSETP
jgi:hypothetical protein